MLAFNFSYRYPCIIRDFYNTMPDLSQHSQVAYLLSSNLENNANHVNSKQIKRQRGWRKVRFYFSIVADAETEKKNSKKLNGETNVLVTMISNRMWSPGESNTRTLNTLGSGLDFLATSVIFIQTSLRAMGLLNSSHKFLS